MVYQISTNDIHCYFLLAPLGRNERKVLKGKNFHLKFTFKKYTVIKVGLPPSKKYSFYLLQ